MSSLTTTLAEAELPLFVGVDLGATNIKLGVVDSRGRTLAYESMPTQSELGVEDAVRRVAAKAHEMLAATSVAGDKVAAVGLATPGTMDIPAGMILEPPNLPWRNFPIRDALSEAVGFPVAYANDANAAAFGEYWVGGGEEFDSIVFLTLGTGVGAGIIIRDVPLDGHHSHGGECGHIIIDSSPEARICGCGQRGHLEAYCSATALVKQAQLHLEAGQQSSLTQRLENGEQLTGLMMNEEAAAGDALCTQVIQELATHLGRGMVTIAHTVDPEAIIIGGAMTFGGSQDPVGQNFLEHVVQTFRNFAFPTLASRTRIGFATLGGNAGYLGSAGIARREYLQKEAS